MFTGDEVWVTARGAVKALRCRLVAWGPDRCAVIVTGGTGGVVFTETVRVFRTEAGTRAAAERAAAGD